MKSHTVFSVKWLVLIYVLQIVYSHGPSDIDHLKE
jgi:hypothetical protein